ncbi:hypothetical protein [Amycolatopsis sp. MJM2582]|uniref:hypothetical protein n=1 Tax=Amycolatopsis sp. MJM2582 TaxID=1427749 RepID=UPI001269F0E0|nr:hypothetical protein [Amycolatopsis sp. MJM2582]
MVELALTAERRDELAMLLDDDQRLRLEYPRVAEYLDMAPQLQGTGDDRADAAFDLRFVHYMTGGASVSSNPYWDIVSPVVSERGDRLVIDGGNPRGSGRLGYAATILQSAYAYAVPSPQTLKWVSGCVGSRPVVELGAGRGYWAAQLAAMRVSVVAYDVEPPDMTDNPSFPSASGQRDAWHPVHNLENFAQHGWPPGSTLFLCWPPGWGSEMASSALAEFEKADGDHLIFVGEPRGGKTGDNAFFDGLAERWSLKSQDHKFVSWWNLNDVAQQWTRK